MINWIVIAIVAGLASAVLHASVLVPSVISIVLFYLAPLPLFIAGLGWGPVVAAFGGLIGAAAMSVPAGLKGGVFFALSAGAAPFILSRLALINRPAQQALSVETEGEIADHGVQWYPEGRLVLWSAVMAAVLMSATIFLTGPDAASFQTLVRQSVVRVFDVVFENQPGVPRADLDKLIEFFVFALPMIAASIWLIATLANLWLAARILRKAGKSLRPWARFSNLAFPRRAGLALCVACLATLLPGTAGLIGWVFASAMMTAFVLLGLAVLHWLSDASPMRVLLLGALYLTLIVLNWLVYVPLVAIALADMMFGIRRRAGAAPPKGRT